MRFLPRNGVKPLLQQRGGIIHSNDLNAAQKGGQLSDPPEVPQGMADYWENQIERKPQPHCLSFLTKVKKSSILDEESSVQGRSTAPALQENNKGKDDEMRDPHPLALNEMKAKTMRLTNKEESPMGTLYWDAAEEVLLCWTQQGTEESVHLSIIMYDRMVEEHHFEPKWSDSQMMFWLKALINNWNQGQRVENFGNFTVSDIIKQVEAWYDCIEVDPEIYALIIDGAAYNEPWLADSLLRRTVESNHKGLIYSHTYNQVIQAWVHAGDPYQAEALLDFMLGEWRNKGDGGIAIAAKPNRQAFHWVLLAWARSDEEVAAERTENILAKMEKYSQTGALANLKPNASTYKWVLDCLIKQSPNKDPQICAQRAQDIIENLKEKADRGDEEFRPTTEMYSLVVDAWGKADDPNRGEELLHELYRDYCARNHDKRLMPNLEIFNNLLKGWSRIPSKVQRRKAGERAEAIVQHMEKLASSGVLPGVKPDLQSYNILLNCWSRCGNGQKAQDLLEKMIQRWELGDDFVAPDTVSYSRVLSAWHRAGNTHRCEHLTNVLLKQFNLGNYRVHPNLILCGLAKFGTQPEALKKAQTLFQTMSSLTASRERKDVKPNSSSYHHLLECILKADQEDCGDQAEFLLNDMLLKFAAGDDDMKPNTAVYNLVMKALIKTGDPTRTEDILAQMYEEDTWGARVYPDLESFNIILQAWAMSNLGEEACKRGEQILRRLERIWESQILDVKPDITSYNTVLQSLATQSKEKTAGKRADLLLRHMGEKEIKPNYISYNHTITALKNCGDVKRANKLLKQLKRKSFGYEDDISLRDARSMQWF